MFMPLWLQACLPSSNDRCIDLRASPKTPSGPGIPGYEHFLLQSFERRQENAIEVTINVSTAI